MFAQSRRLSITHEGGFVRTELKTIQKTGVVFGRVRSTGHEIDLQDTEKLILLLPRSGHLRIRMGGREYSISHDSPMVLRPGERLSRALAGRSGHFTATTIQIPLQRIMALSSSAASGGGAFAEDATGLRGLIGNAVMQCFNQMVDSILQEPQTDLPSKIAAAVDHMIDEHFVAMMDRAEPRNPPRLLQAFHRVRHAEEIMRAHEEDPLSMVDLANHLGISLRSLQLAFREVHDGKSPRQVYGQIRLERARRRLLEADAREQVTTIALDAGFAHLSRFAQSYARAFGELPSQTLSRRRRTSSPVIQS